MTNIGKLKLNKIHLGDCIDLLKRIPDNSVDLIFADPPYNLQLNGDLYRPNQTRVSAVNDEWDRFQSMEEYDRFTGEWAYQCRRVLKETGSFWVIGTYHNIFRVGRILQDLGFWILNDIIWVKTNPMPNFKGTRFNNAHETLIWAAKSRSSRYTFHYHSMKVMNDDLQMRSDWMIPICQGKERIKENGRKAHSTQKPEELLHRIIISTSNPDDLVLDPFMGSGTTAAVAKKLGRSFIGFEREQEYVRIANERLKKVNPITESLLQYNVEKKKPKVPFGNLIEAGFVRIGEDLYSKDQNNSARVQADASLVYNGEAGSIHKISARILNRENNNGWTFWYIERKGKLISIDQLRSKYVEKYHSPEK